MTAPESLTPVGDSLRARHGGKISTHALGTDDDPAGCEHWHSWCAYLAGRGEALRQLAADCDDEARGLAQLGEAPWSAMLGRAVPDAAEHVAALRRMAELARNRADAPPAPPNVSALAAAPPAAARAEAPPESHP